MLKLVGTDGKRYYSWILEPGKYLIGRKGECDFCVPHRTVSRRHAEIEVGENGKQIYLSDLGSRNGTLVNGVMISDRVEIKQNDLIMFGNTEFKVVTGEPAEAAPVTRSRTALANQDPENSIYLSMNEALKPWPAKVMEVPELLPTLLEMAKMLVLPEPQEKMLERSLAMVARIIPAERLAVLFVSGDLNEVYTAASLLTGGKDPGEFRLSRTIINEIVKSKSAILLGDPQEDPRFADRKSIIMSELKSAIAVPLFDEERVLGILYADTTNPLHRYDDDYLRVLATFGNILASRLLNYELLEERQRKQIMDAELSRASLIQKNLLPAGPPEIPGYDIYDFQEQSRSVGGDLYDYGPLSDERLIFMVADVSGKGMGASLLMSTILASFRILYDDRDFDLLEAVRRVSLHMFNSSDSGDFATLFIGILESKQNRIRYVNAGHNPPVLFRADGKHEHLQASGVMIGAFDFATWEEEVIDLQPGDLLFVFSDGVTEAEHNDRQYGEERMEKVVLNSIEMRAQEIVGRLISDINKFMEDDPKSDDITILAIKRGRE